METASRVGITLSDTRTPRPKKSFNIGDRLNVDVYTGNGLLLLPAGAKIETISILNRIKQPDIRFGDGDIVLEDVSQEPVNLKDPECWASCDPQKNEEVVEAFDKRIEAAKSIRDDAIEEVNSLFERLNAEGQVDIKSAENIAGQLVNETFSDPVALASMTQLRDSDEYTFSHSVNVCILATSLAIQTGKTEELELIATGALLHDIGKVSISHDILHKPDRLTDAEMEIMKRHPLIGTRMLLESGERRESVIACVRDHHEKRNGNGYPNGIKAWHISFRAMMTAVADIFDALTTKRPYREALSAQTAIGIMAGKMQDDLDPSLMKHILSVIGYYPMGSTVELTDNSIGRIVHQFKDNPTRPVVQIVKDADGNDPSAITIIDLNKNFRLGIRKAVSI